MEVWFNSLDTPPQMWKYRVSLYHFPSRVPHGGALDFDLQLRKQSALAAFWVLFCFLRSWTCGLAWPAARPATAAVLLLEAELCVCFHCSCWEWKMGGTLGYLWVGPSGCVRRRNCPLHTMYRQAFQWAKTSRVNDLGIQPQLFKTQRLSRCRAMWGWELK